MKKIRLTFSKKIIILFLLSISFTLLFSFFFIHFLYSKLYLSSIEQSIIYQGQRTAAHYHYGELSDEIIEKIQWYNMMSEYEVIVVDNLDDFSSYFPYEINRQSFLNDYDYKTLESGKYVVKEGFVKEFNREIIGAIFPIKGNDKLLGFIYIYLPLAAIQDVFKESFPLLIGVGTAFFLLLFAVVSIFWQSFMHPLKQLEKQAMNISKGRYGQQLPIQHDDEVGKVTHSFNLMSASLAEQEMKQKEFIANVVHELRTPLTYISGYTEALKYEALADERENYLNTIQKETQRMTKLIADLVDLSHLEEGFNKMTKEPLPIAQVLLDTLALFSIARQQKNVEIVSSIDESLIVLGDRKRIQQIFYNLIDNALKYCLVNGKVSVSLSRDNGFAQFIVQNDGTLIAMEDLPHVTERFFRTDKARNRKTGGTGLGLSIVKEITRLHDGTFTIVSNENVGTMITIKIPLIKDDL